MELTSHRDAPAVVVTPQIRFDSFCPVVRPLLANLTEKQWELIKAGKPNCSTNAMLAVLVLDLISAVTDFFSEHKEKGAVGSENLVASVLGDKLFYTFKEVLGIRKKVPKDMMKELAVMIGKEVEKTLSISASQRVSISRPSGNSFIFPVNPCTSPSELDTMVVVALEILKKFAPLRTNLSNPQQQRARESSILHSGIQTVIGQEVHDLTGPFLANVPDFEYEVIKSETLQDMLEVVPDTELFIVEPRNFQNVNLSMCIFRCFAKALIYRTLTQLRKKYLKEKKTQSSEVILTLLASIDSMLDHGLRAVFVTNLCNLMYHHLTNKCPGEVLARVSRDNLYVDIWSKASSLQALLDWWLKTQSSYHTGCMVRDVKEGYIEELKRLSVKLIVMHILVMLLRMIDKEEHPLVFQQYYEHSNSATQYLSDAIWTSLKDIEIPLSKRDMLKTTLTELLCQKCGSPEEVLYRIFQRDRKVEKIFVACLKEKLTQKRPLLSRFISMFTPPSTENTKSQWES